MDVEFRLAQIDPKGNTTTGIVYHETKSGFGLNNPDVKTLASYAWDNYKYMNVHIQLVIKSGSQNNSGVAWFPDTDMSDKGTARVVYNGKYIKYSPPASSLTHEFGHFFGLEHTFKGGCVRDPKQGDLVHDTPPTKSNTGKNCSSDDKNCFGETVNYQNHMGYNPCEAMFTKGQVTRMERYMQHDARITLWKDKNLVETGVKKDLGARIIFNYQNRQDSDLDKLLFFLENFENTGSIINKKKIKAIAGAKFATRGILKEGTHFTSKGVPQGLKVQLEVTDDYTAEITLQGRTNRHDVSDSTEFSITLLDPVIVGGISSIFSSSGTYAVKFLKKYENYYELFSPRPLISTTNETQEHTLSGFESFSLKSSLKHGLMNYDGNTLCILTDDTYQVLCNADGQSVARLSEGQGITPSLGTWISKFKTPLSPDNPEDNRRLTLNPILSSPQHTQWHGKSGFVAIRKQTITDKYIYAWLKVEVSKNGKIASIIESGINPSIDKSITAGKYSLPHIEYSSDRFLESPKNDGTIHNKIIATLYGGASFNTNKKLKKGQDYKVRNVPGGFSLSINITSDTTAELVVEGKQERDEYNKGWGYNSNIKIEFFDTAFRSQKASGIVHSKHSLNAEYKGASFTEDLKNKVMTRTKNNGLNAQFVVLNSHQAILREIIVYQLHLYDRGRKKGVKLISWGRDIVANDNYEVTPLDHGAIIGSDSSWKRGREYYSGPGQHMVDSDTYQAWRGKTKYIGFRINRSKEMYYGWIKFRVSSDGETFEFLKFGINGVPEKGIKAGTLESIDNPDDHQEDTEAPTAPTNLIASDITENTINLSWQASTDNVEVTEYIVYQDNKKINSSIQGTSTNISGLHKETTYKFYVVAKDKAGNTSDFSKTLNVTTKQGETDNICNGIEPWSSSVLYKSGDRIAISSNLFEMSPNGNWKQIGECNTTKNTGKNQLLLIAPNPVNDIINIILPVSKHAKYSIINMFGKEVKKGMFTSRINVEGLQDGIYFIKVDDKKGTRITRFVKN